MYVLELQAGYYHLSPCALTPSKDAATKFPSHVSAVYTLQKIRRSQKQAYRFAAIKPLGTT